MGGRSLILGLHAVALLLAAWPSGAAFAEEAKAGLPLPERAPRGATAGQGAEVELPVKAPRSAGAQGIEEGQSDTAATGAVGDPHDEASRAEPPAEPAPQALDAAPAKQEKAATPVSQPTSGDRASSGTAASAAQKRAGAPKPAATAAPPQPSNDAQKAAVAGPAPAPSEDDKKPAEIIGSPASDHDQMSETAPPPSIDEQQSAETAASRPGADEPKPATTPEPNAEEQEPVETASPESSDSAPKPAGAASPAGDDAQDAAAAEGDQKPADTAAAPSADDEQNGDDQGADTAAAPPIDAAQKPAGAAAPPASDAGQKPAGVTPLPVGESDPASPAPEPTPPPPSNPVVAAVLSQLKDPVFAKGANTADLSALKAFYAGHGDATLWISGTALSDKAQAIIDEIGKAGEWGLSAEAFDLPPAGSSPSTPDAQAADELKLGLAILKYARFARGGRLMPSRVSVLFDQKPRLRDPKTVLTEIAASDDPASYLRALHPKHEQFSRLRQALLAALSQGETGDKKSSSQVQRLVVNMERWRWMPPELGAYYVWNNVPSFGARVIKGGKTIYAERIIVGQLKYATPFFSANMSSIVFHPEWTVPETILKEDLQPSLQQGGFFGVADTSILKRHGLRVSHKGKPIDAKTVDWLNVNIREYTFTQAPGPDNVLGQLKFNFPNRHAVYMHDTPQRELFAETVRTLSHGCIRVREPDRLAALLLAEDKGWSADQVKVLLARDENNVVKLGRTVPVHLTYFTAVADDTGKIDIFSDVYGLDGRMATALFGSAATFSAPVALEATAGAGAEAQPAPRKKRGDWTSATGIPGLFGN